MRFAVIVLLFLCTSQCTAQLTVPLGRRHHRFLRAAHGQTQPRPFMQLQPSRFRAGSVVPLQGGLLSLGYYYTEVLVGTPPVSFTVLLDTGSSNLALASVACDSSCSASSQLYDPSRSSTASPWKFGSPSCEVCNPDPQHASECLFGQPMPAPTDSSLCGYGISYGGGSSFVSGYVVNDTTSLGGFTVTSPIVVMSSQVPSGGLTHSPINGIIGLANEPNAVNPSWAPTIFGQMVAANELPNEFGLCLNSTSGGVLDLGFADSSHYDGELQWVPMTEHRWYNMKLLDVAVGNTSLGLQPIAYAYSNDQIGAFIDSGTSALLLCPACIESLQSIFQAQYCSLPLVCSQSNIFTGACISDSQMKGHLAEFPTLYLTFAGESGPVVLSTPPSSYFLHAQGQYCFSVSGVPSVGAVLGDVFMENYYIIHDRDNWRIGFAPIKTC